MTRNRKYALIKKADYEVYFGVMTDDKFIVYVDSYLNKNNMDYDIKALTRVVYIKNKIEALRIGRDLRLQTIEYFDGVASQIVKLTKKALKYRKQVAFVEDTRTGAKQTLKQFKKNTPARIKEEGILKSEVIKTGLATNEVLEKLTKQNKLHVTKLRNRLYFDRIELANALFPN